MSGASQLIEKLNQENADLRKLLQCYEELATEQASIIKKLRMIIQVKRIINNAVMLLLSD